LLFFAGDVVLVSSTIGHLAVWQSIAGEESDELSPTSASQTRGNQPVLDMEGLLGRRRAFVSEPRVLELCQSDTPLLPPGPDSKRIDCMCIIGDTAGWWDGTSKRPTGIRGESAERGGEKVPVVMKLAVLCGDQVQIWALVPRHCIKHRSDAVWRNAKAPLAPVLLSSTSTGLGGLMCCSTARIQGQDALIFGSHSGSVCGWDVERKRLWAMAIHTSVG
jgi:hypothetical protein